MLTILNNRGCYNPHRLGDLNILLKQSYTQLKKQPQVYSTRRLF